MSICLWLCLRLVAAVLLLFSTPPCLTCLHRRLPDLGYKAPLIVSFIRLTLLNASEVQTGYQIGPYG
jgi:uncharacterized membrane protein YhaH (DUF805 family)